jgi:hypothetical protein
VLQGLTLPLMIKKVKMPEYDDHEPEAETVTLIKEELARESLSYLEENHPDELEHSPLLQKLVKGWHSQLEPDENDINPQKAKAIYKKILEKQRQLLLHKNRRSRINEEIIRKFLHQIDLEEEKLRSG